MLQLRSKAFKKMLEAARAEVGFESSDWFEYVNPSTSKNRRDEIIKKYGSRGESVRRIFDELKGEWDT